MDIFDTAFPQKLLRTVIPPTTIHMAVGRIFHTYMAPFLWSYLMGPGVGSWPKLVQSEDVFQIFQTGIKKESRPHGGERRLTD